MSDTRTDDLLEAAWGIIANAHGGDWALATDEWRVAAARWRDEWLARLAQGRAAPPTAERDAVAAAIICAHESWRWDREINALVCGCGGVVHCNTLTPQMAHGLHVAALLRAASAPAPQETPK